jgi:putative transposase
VSQIHSVKSASNRKLNKPISRQQISEGIVEDANGEMVDSQHLLISLLLPPAIKAFFLDLETEITELCGDRYRHTNQTHSRYGSQPGSIILGNQRIAIQRPRVRDFATNKEVVPPVYTKFQDPGVFDSVAFEEGLKHVSQRDFKKGLPKIAASFGTSKSSVSRSWVKTTKKQVEKLLNRSLAPLGIVAVFIDGKRFAKQGVVVAFGVGEDGKKLVLGIYQSSTESSAACKNLLDDLERRGLPEKNLLFIVDGGSGLNKALNEKYEIESITNCRAVRVRCYVHKWRNIEDVLDSKGNKEALPLFTAIRGAKDLTTAKICSEALEGYLKRYNVSALNSYLEAKDDLLAIHKLNLGPRLKKFFSTTNPIESLNSLLEEDLRRVKTWKNSEHFQRWVATACLQNENRMRRVEGFSALPALKVRLQEVCKQEELVDKKDTAA